MTAIERFAQEHRLHVRRDDCGDAVIYGSAYPRDGQGCERQLYFDGDELCLMVLNGAVVKRDRWQALSGKLWLGDISPNPSGKRVQDVQVTGIPLTHAKTAIRLARVKTRRVMSEAQAAVLARARAALKGV